MSIGSESSFSTLIAPEWIRRYTGKIKQGCLLNELILYSSFLLLTAVNFQKVSFVNGTFQRLMIKLLFLVYTKCGLPYLHLQN